LRLDTKPPLGTDATSGTAGIVQTKKARMAAAVQWCWNIAAAAPNKRVRPPGAGDLGKRLQTARLGDAPADRAVTFKQNGNCLPRGYFY
jgi:hypothetical protein